MNLDVQLGTLLDLLETSASNKDRSFSLQRITSLEKAGPHDLAVVLDRGDASVFDEVGLKAIEQSKAGLILSEKPIVPGKNYLLVQDSLKAFGAIVTHFTSVGTTEVSPHAVVSKKATVDSTAVIEATAVIADGASIGKGSVIKAGAYVGAQAVIGDYVLLHPGAKVLERCHVGDYSVINAGAVIGSEGFGFQVARTGLRKIPQVGIVFIGKHVEVGANCSIDRASFEQTILEDHVKLDNNVHIAHNVVIGAGTAILAQTGIAGGAKVGRACQIGGQVAIKDKVVVGNQVKIVSKTAVMSDLKDGEVVCGIPAQPFGKWKRMVVVSSRLPELAKAVKRMQTIAEKFSQKPSFFTKLAKAFGLSK